MFAAIVAVTLMKMPVPDGRSTQNLDVGKLSLETFLYKPKTYSGRHMLMVMHGTLRNAEDYRNDAEAMGERFGALIVVPKFDSERFPSLKYQRGGILKEDGTLADASEWTYSLIPKIAEQIRALTGDQLRLYVIGHSAGGQFAMRMAGFAECGAERIVAANPGTDLFPTREMPYGHGFGKLPEPVSSDSAIKRYLAQPLTIYLGTADCVEDEYLDMGELSLKQGAGRLQRGRTCFELGQKLAAERGWPFGWTLVKARGIGHDHTAMFNHPICEVALFGNYRSGDAPPFMNPKNSAAPE